MTTHSLLKRRSGFGLQISLITIGFIIGLLVFLILWNKQLTTIQAEHDRLLGTARSQIDVSLGDIRNSVMIIRGLIENRHYPHVDAASIDTMNQQFLELAAIVPNLLQLRLLTLDGVEVIKVVVDEQGAQALSGDDLQDKSNRYYARAGSSLSANEIYISPLDLNREFGEIVVPVQPTVRAVIPITFGNGERYVLVVNYLVGYVLDSMRALSTDMATLYAFNSFGQWVLHNEPATEWQQTRFTDPILSALTVDDIRQLSPDNIEKPIQYDGYSNLINGLTVDFNPLDEKRSDDHLFILASTDRQQILALAFGAFIPSALITVAFLIVSLAIWQKELRYRQRLLRTDNKLREKAQSLRKALREQRVMQDELVESKKLSALGMTVAGVAHELNTPIGGAIMAISCVDADTQALESDLSQGLTHKQMDTFIKRQKEGVALAMRNLQRSADLVTSFKRLAIERNSDEPSWFSVKQVVHDLATTINPLLRKRGIKLHIDIADSASMRSMAGTLSQILQNLIMNTVEHAFPEARSGNVTVRVIEKEDKISVTVIDDGCGIDEGVKPILFDPFVTSGRGAGHTGLGLYLVYQWVTKVMKGRITVNTHDGGTSFTLTMPKDLLKLTSERHSASPQASR
ncbi:sensor histidine kinase [Alteromonas oceanisediminis]|uniref:sensor histidine kinase n=1 Tax=Alteromonas oceanisediminis TaxID=2836180 RepID=UPI001BD9A3C9|nr:HAMP domain-containing sensor histidine kinase [Alteromonas oceanisediminis]MBT0585850.1 HAMP domain-containing histidine kinase [Alteromonas oceanisediminis]